MATPRPIVVIGSINIDLVCRTPRRPVPGETVLGRDFQAVPGGKGANQAVAAARLGASVHLIARIGDDTFGSQTLRGLQIDRVNVDHVSVTAGVPSGVAMIVVDDAGDNSIIVVPGANAHLTPADIDAAEPIIAQAACVMLQLEIPYATVQHAIDLCRRHNIYTILDPAPAPVAMPENFYRVDLLTPNHAEARTLTGCTDDASAGQQLLLRGPAAVVLKCGDRGATIVTADGVKMVPPFPITALDTTAAGDAFTAALAVGLSEKFDLPVAVQLANAAGALACTRLGAQPSLPTREAVDALRLPQVADAAHRLTERTARDDARGQRASVAGQEAEFTRIDVEVPK